MTLKYDMRPMHDWRFSPRSRKAKATPGYIDRMWLKFWKSGQEHKAIRLDRLNRRLHRGH